MGRAGVGGFCFAGRAGGGGVGNIVFPQAEEDGRWNVDLIQDGNITGHHDATEGPDRLTNPGGERGTPKRAWKGIDRVYKRNYCLRIFSMPDASEDEYDVPWERPQSLRLPVDMRRRLVGWVAPAIALPGGQELQSQEVSRSSEYQPKPLRRHLPVQPRGLQLRPPRG